MKFERLELLNFASYYGEHVIDLSTSSDRPVVVILGGTGFGKTTLFDAINWSLYGRDYERDLPDLRRGRTILDYVNETALIEAEAEDHFVEMSCVLYFEHDGSHYYISQSLAAGAYRDEEGALKANQTDRLTALYEIAHTGNHKEIKYDSLFLDEILPNNVRDYFLFDGDRIYHLSQPGSSKEVRDAIYRVVDLELLANARDHLSHIATEYRRSAARESKGDLSKIEEEYDLESRRLEKLRNQLKETKEEKNSIESQLLVLEEKLKNLPDTSELQGRRKELEASKRQLETELEATHATLRSWAATAGLAFAKEPAFQLMSMLDSKRHKGEIPKAVSQTLLRDLIKLERCICGTEFKEGDPIYKELSDRLQAELAKPNDQALLDLLIDLRQASTLVDEAGMRIREEDKRLYRLKDEKRETNLAIDQIDSDLDKLPKVDVATLISEARDRRNALVANERRANELTSRINGREKKIRELEKQRIELGKSQDKVRKLQLREQLAKSSAREIDRIYDVFAEESRQAVEALTIQEFKHFVKSASGYAVSLSNEYELEVLDSNGNRALQRLSMGQSQCLSLSFITAISRVSEKNPPLVIDMPFGRLDKSVHHAVSARLPEITRQLILFLIPSIEWNDTTKANLAPVSSQIYELEFDEKRRQTTILEASN